MRRAIFRRTALRRTAVLLLLSPLALCAIAQSASATFAGRNGAVVFAARASGDPKALYRINPPRLKIRLLIPVGAGEDRAPAWSSDGATLAFASERSGQLDIWSVQPGSGTGPVNLTATDSEGELLPTWSPDDRVAFVTLHGTGSADTTIDVMDADGANRITIRSPGKPIFGIEWSPLGTRIAYAVPDGSGTDIYSIRPDGTGRIRLANDLPRATLYDWRPDGRRILFQGETGSGQGLYEIAVGGEHRQYLLTAPASPVQDEHASYSPNGEKIVFVSDLGPRDELWLMRADGSNERRLRRIDPLRAYGMAWQPR
jgi:Tol biopolymer transport system component